MHIKNIFRWSGTMKYSYSIYETEWQGISLLDLAAKKNIRVGEAAAEDFYADFYRILGESDWKIDNKWIDMKKNIGKWLKSIVDKRTYEQHHEMKILSIGSGLGIVEEELIKENYDIELQECQEESLKFLKSKKIYPKKEWVCQSLVELPSNHYDMLFCNLVVYSLSDNEYNSLIVDCNRILKINGQLIIIDVPTTFIWYVLDPIRKLKHRVDNKAHLLWGVARSTDMHKKIVERKGFKLHDIITFNGEGKISLEKVSARGYIFMKEEK
jgi:2-polyprenyl-3-methyl-5-hydroxy-6-metoxy-1,4-benzoquinol methylase